MRVPTKCIALWVISFGFFCFALEPAYGDQLIEPTRTLKGSPERSGLITVFSEPPQMAVFLDETSIGQTPIWRKKIAPGLHRLQVMDLKKELYLEPGKYLKIGLFKGSFIVIPQEKRKPKAQRIPEEEKQTELAKPVELPEEQRQKDLTLWEKFINGTSPHF